MTTVITVKSSGLAKTGGPVRQLATRLERALQSRNEKIARADADYVAACERAIAGIRHASEDIAETPATDTPDVPAEETPASA